MLHIFKSQLQISLQKSIVFCLHFWIHLQIHELLQMCMHSISEKFQMHLGLPFVRIEDADKQLASNDPKHNPNIDYLPYLDNG